MRPQFQPTLSGNPRPLDSGNDYDRIQRYSRIVTGYACLITVAFVAQTGFTWSLFPLKEIVPQFVYFSDSRDQVVSVDARNVSRDTRDLIAEKLIREYVTDRETINQVDDRVRYPRVQRFSSATNFAAFRKQFDPKNPDSPLRSYYDNGMSREIHIEIVTPTSYKEGIYAVDFVAIDRKGEMEVSRKLFTASLQVEYGQIKTKPEWASENPIGLTIGEYTIRNRDTSESTKGTNP